MQSYNEDLASITQCVIALQKLVTTHKEIAYGNLPCAKQKIVVQRYAQIVEELTQQLCISLKLRAISTAESLNRVLIEQSVNLLYVALDTDGSKLKALLENSIIETRKSATRWLKHLESIGQESPVAQARFDNAVRIKADFEQRNGRADDFPKIRERFAAVGWEDYYYMFYAPLCDSVHTYSDDMLNLVNFEIHMADDVNAHAMRGLMESERRRLTIYHSAVSVSLYAESFGRIFMMSATTDVIEAIRLALKPVISLVERHESHDADNRERADLGNLFKGYEI
ncbi:DUF5677 domain-containing protein [Pseudomonas poae]|nr:DUF5677 domain-containing protein [Pseudomonas poae]